MPNSVTRRTFGGATLGAALALAMIGGPALAQTKTLRLSHHLQPGHLVDVASHRFADLVSEATGGEIAIEVFPAGQIAGLRQGAEAVQLGTVDIVWSDFGTLANWRPEYGFVSLPFMFQGDDHFEAVFGGPVGEELAASLKENLNIETLGYGNAGFRVIATRDAPVNGPEDLVGVRIRVPEVPTFVNAFNAIDANPTPMAWGEVYTALQTGVINAVENPAEGLAVGDMNEVTNYLSRTLHIMTDVNLFANGAMMEGLTEEQQAAMREAAATAVDEFNTATREASASYWDELAATMEVVEEPDRAAFQAAMAPVWDDFTAATGDAGQHWIDVVTAAAPN
ncbi:TRAP transporter substrate-binding protein [Roseisalinus antarcticus]|uniref:2,3-diketo-L-gulonate-binding periplasmic protein YiaO n=1 Tax=Roseisalinus antarcticus TaxID=254357 RepID=A0A1Y5TI52_9RHOB|nr:TRAP transporter substrate-binding protein [Roseisalinus antarcticus]SLN64631.1 2,3-diketo-L-gulonate-binding periplasmic protein YiaO precursor [Roseisalinus antarcticus]